MGFCPYLDDVKDDEKSNGEKISTVEENSVGKRMIVDSNGCDGAINGKSTRYCSKEILIGRFSIDSHALVLLDSYMLINFLFKLIWLGSFF